MISLTLDQYLARLWGYKDKSVLSRRTDASEIQQLEAHINEAIFHLEYQPGDIVVVWRAADWAIDIKRYQLQKAESEKRIREHDAKKECIAYLESLIVQKLGDLVGAQMAPGLAREIVEKKQTQTALMFGAMKERLVW